ncbi:MAG: formylglycine-generating enzyme family protein, partial [Acidiferrobacterales bacterium]
ERMVRVEGGEYTIGTDTGPRDARPAHTVELEPFLIDRFEVTNAEYARFLNTLDVTVLRDAEAGRVRKAHVGGPDADRVLEEWGAPSHRTFIGLGDMDARIALIDRRFMPSPDYEDHPVTEVTWYGARAFCAWRSARLPTEAEWEVTARGRKGRSYPWGEAPPSPERAVFARRRGHTEPVGLRSAGATPEGVHDLAGSLAEWTHTLYRPYPYDDGDGREDPDQLGERVTRGGDYVFDTTADRLTTFFRGGFSRAPDRGHRHIGFRCAKST